MIALISDIHSNLEALTTVLDDIKKKGISDIICLGDIVGYAADPVECLNLVRNCKIVIMGNHDESLLQGAIGFTPHARDAMEWTIKQLKPHWFSSGGTKSRWDFITNLPTTYLDRDVLYVHGSPRDPTTEYIVESDIEPNLEGAHRKLQHIFEMFPRLCFVGHTHQPGIITQDYRFLKPSDFNYSFEFEDSNKYIINVGSVGQPRDGDKRSCYVIFDNNKITYCRLSYDYHKTKDKIIKTNALSEYFGERLESGK
ncbi:MAG: metallophosphoesterase family protein [Planctomycetota bacterium]|nr:metallophosphoesterase family protein [Planctomycetota bacterium]MDI6787012.1 metallophosphoesterase family protein [Planctomycetota bacterium]